MDQLSLLGIVAMQPFCLQNKQVDHLLKLYNPAASVSLAPCVTF